MIKLHCNRNAERNFKEVPSDVHVCISDMANHHDISSIGCIRSSYDQTHSLLSGQIVLYITGIFAFVGFAFPTHKLLPERYYHISDPKKLNRIFKILGVSSFRKFLLLTFWISKKDQQKYFDGTVSGLENLSIQTQKSEFGHLIPFIILVLVSIIFVFKGAYLLGFFMLFFNIAGNLYPVILQRYHRMRIQRLSKISHRLIRRRK